MRITEIKIVNATGEELKIKTQITYILKEQAVTAYDYRKITKIDESEDMEGLLEIIIEKEE